MKKIELLAPVGGYEQFIAAVNSGADAVYLGGTSFNARNSANNFSDEELSNAINYAHIRGVKVHLTLNTLIYESEIEDVIKFAVSVYNMGVDAFIIQDLGVIKRLREVIPDVVIHFSTQGTIYSLEGVKAVSNFNFERIVLSRELSLDEIENICKNTDTEIEVFVHGALCICYSGQCRISSLVGGRSGNRGKCAQPCRLQYSLYENEKKVKSEYILSPKDLCGINDLVKLIKIGVTSLKIEGRLKSPEYVACVTSIYRKYIELAYNLIEIGEEEKYKVDEEDIKKLAQVFNRGGFSRGYYYNEVGSQLMSYERPKHWGTYLGKVLGYDKKRKLVKIKLSDQLNMGDGIEIVNENLPGNIVTYIEKDKRQVKAAIAGEVIFAGDILGNINEGDTIYKISDIKLNSELKRFIDGKKQKKILVNMELCANVGENVKLKVSDFDGNEILYVSEYSAEKALNRPISLDNANSALSKLGDTPFLLNSLILNTDNKALVPMAILNNIRREAVNLLIEKRVMCNRKVKYNKQIKEEIKNNCTSKISVYLYNTKKLEGLELADRIYVPISDYSEELCSKLSGKEVIPYFNSITKNLKHDVSNIDSVLVGNLEHLEICKDVKNKYCDFSFNVFNSVSCKTLKDNYDVKGVNLSFELSLEDIKEIQTTLEKEVTVYGRLPIMTSEHCVIGSEITGKKNCGLCKMNNYCLEDRMGEKFPIITDRNACRMSILNSKILYAGEVVKELNEKVDYFRVYFLDEDINERRRILKAIKSGEEIRNTGYTSGNFYKKV